MIRIILTSGQAIRTGQVAACTVGGVAHIVHDHGMCRVEDVQSIELGSA